MYGIIYVTSDMIYIICNIYIYDMLTFNIHTGRSLLIFATYLQANVECLVKYPTGEDHVTPHSVTFMKRFGTQCECCACTQRFDECQCHP